MRRTEESPIHEPWEKTQAPEDVQLADLREDYGGDWRIWRGMSANRVAGAWHARRAAPDSALRADADTAEGLRRVLLQAEAIRSGCCEPLRFMSCHPGTHPARRTMKTYDADDPKADRPLTQAEREAEEDAERLRGKKESGR